MYAVVKRLSRENTMGLLLRVLYVAGILAVLSLLSRYYPRSSGFTQSAPLANKVLVTEVIDGDTVGLSDGRRVRYLSIDTPERGEPGYERAKVENESLVLGRWVEMRFTREKRDHYDRVLADLYVNGRNVSDILRERGCEKPPHQRR